MLLVTLVAILLVAVVLVMLIVSGPWPTSIGDVIGLGSQAVTVWNIAKWPVIVVFVVADRGDALLRDTQREAAAGSAGCRSAPCVAILIWILASVGFAFYVATFGSYDKTYGSLAGVVVGLLWLWITNVALLFGAELDSELERGRQLQAGIAAEAELQLPGARHPGHPQGPQEGAEGHRARQGHPRGGADARRTRMRTAPTGARPARPEERRPSPHRDEGETPMRKLMLLAASRHRLRAGSPGRPRALRADQGAPSTKVTNDPRVQEKAQQAVDMAKEQAPVVADKVTSAASAAGQRRCTAR